MKSLTSSKFWQAYAALPPHARLAARKAYHLWQQNPQHPSLRFQKRGRYWRACFGSGYRALAVALPEGYLWFWIGPHDEYERLLVGR
jgi:hypothetical protein